MTGAVRIGVDFGGTKIEAAALSPAGDYLTRKRQPTPRDYDRALRVVKDLIAEVEAEVGATGPIGVGSPGSISPRTGLMRNANSTYLNGRQFDRDLETTLGRPVRVVNDANCLALSEAMDGAAAGHSSAYAIIVGTGCGGGLVVGGQLVNGANGLAGEWGHMPLPWPRADETPGPKCWCGLNNCMETWVSGTGFARDFNEHTGRNLNGEAIVEAARAGDAEAVAAFDALLDRLARGMAVVCNLVDPDAFVFGGGLSKVPEIYDRLPKLIEPYVFSDGWSATIAPAKWGDSSGVRGAAWLWAQSETTDA